MANVDYRDLFWQVRTEAPGVPYPVLFSHYAEAVREFCRRSYAWQYSCPNALDLNASTDWPSLTEGTDIPTNTYVVQPVSVKWKNGKQILFKTRDQLDKIDGDWEQLEASVPEYWTISSPGNWRIYPLLSSNETSAIYLRVALAPKLSANDSATGIPEPLANEWQHLWAYGALSKLLSIPGKDWSNPRQASSYLALFEQGIKEAKSRAAADYGRPNRKVAYGGLSIGGSGKPVTDDYGR